MLKKNKIKVGYSTNITKAPFVERVQRTIEQRIFKYLESHNTKRYINILPQIVRAYNNQKHRITGFAPRQAFQEKNREAVLRNLRKNYYTSSRKKRTTAKYEEGTPVRIQRHKGSFHRSYKQQNTSEIYKIYAVHRELPRPTYSLCNYDDSKEVIIGRFYESEITPARQVTFRIAKILDQKMIARRKMYLVRWEGFTKQSDSWIPAKDITQVMPTN